ncbi:uncharacterized protein MYCFIDRAFT_49316 [Pseudocercospora fijiensis CIRAD86]|uniref:Phosphoribosylaminoimidazole-succinocarboxamide synthase n=1 Tax=Pseudocercospora fijiensis (strain CIRAD86) TaxID=383855 RepID=M2ZB21_PSEFD|nr:uncharacterized protein MYCFIDRAFT_49316 [Pseudocercospora fijiensis CIRAD86]EME87050.1 hypothetical protein MYCFIDRAFT_49316 [Pseudocercospora fijiensis CIRAD86]
MSSSLTPTRQQPDDAFVLRQTNVSNPSVVVHHRPSLQSVTASEDYYSLSGSNSSTHSNDILGAAGRSQHTITRFQTPPSRYRTPQQSSTALAQTIQGRNGGEPEGEEAQHRKTPMRGEGKRRLSSDEAIGAVVPLVGASSSAPPNAQTQLREGGLRRKPIPSVVMEHGSPPRTANRISPTLAQSSTAQQIDRESDAPTPGVDDTPYIHFALDQLTRDEEVRGSRRYADTAPGRHRYEEVPQEEKREEIQQQPYDNIDVRNPQRPSQPGSRQTRPAGPDVFMPVSQAESRQPPLNFVPGIVRPLALAGYALLVTLFLICLIFTAIWSRVKTGLWAYASFGDARYFVFQYLPTILGMILLVWLFQIVIAVYRIAPFIAMGPGSPPPSRLAGAKLPLVPRGFVLPYFGHFGARLPMIGLFVFIAWLQIWTIPLLGSSFNVHQDNNHVWHWIATQGAIWAVVGLYMLQILALLVLMIYLRRAETGLKWDPRSLADMIVLLERSNALDGEGETAPQVGYWRSAHRPTEVFHAYGIADKPARQYGVEDGRIREKHYSDQGTDLESAPSPQIPRHSKEAMLRRSTDETEIESREEHRSSAMPWFLTLSFAILWPIIAIVLVLAFLIVSYLPSTAVSGGFDPQVPAAVADLGFSGTNFLYSVVPGVIALLVFLFWIDIDLAHRRLAPFESLTGVNAAHARKSKSWTDDLTGDVAERTLLPSYAADLPVVATLAAAFNSHWRVAFISAVALLNMAIPILATGIFWAQFDIPTQRVKIYAHMPAYYALSAFLTINALAYLAIIPSSTLRHAALPPHLNSFAGIRDCVYQSRLLDDFAFRNPVSKIDLVTRLLSSSSARHERGDNSGYYAPLASGGLPPTESKVSLADSVRGYGRARVAAQSQPVPVAVDAPIGGGPSRYAFSRFPGRDGRDCFGIDRVRAG